MPFVDPKTGHPLAPGEMPRPCAAEWGPEISSEKPEPKTGTTTQPDEKECPVCEDPDCPGECDTG